MKLKKFLLVLILLNGKNLLHGQVDEKYHSVILGMESLRVKDESVLPVSVTGTGGSVSYSYRKQTANRNSVFSTAWTKALFSSADSRLQLNKFSIMLSDGFLINRKGAGFFKAYLGYSIDANPSFLKLRDKQLEKFSWNSVNSLNVYQAYTYKRYRSSFSFSFHIPLIGFSSRPDNNTKYPTDFNGVLYNSYSNLSLTSLHNYKAVNLDLSYEHRINAKWKFKAGLNYKYSDLETTLPVQLQSAGIQAGLLLQIN